MTSPSSHSTATSCTDIDLTAMLAFHRERGAAVTIALHHVEDARAFGLVETDADGRVEEFREKPEDLMPGDVNAGTYLIGPGGATRVDPRPCDLDRAGDLPGRDRRRGIRYSASGNATGWISARRRSICRRTYDLLAGPCRRRPTRRRGSPRPPTSSRARSLGAPQHHRRRGAVADGAVVEDSVVHPGACRRGRRRRAASIVGPGAQVGRRGERHGVRSWARARRAPTDSS